MTLKSHRVPTGSHRVRDPLNSTGSPSPPPYGGTRSIGVPWQTTKTVHRVPKQGPTQPQGETR